MIMGINTETKHIGFIVTEHVFRHFGVPMDSLYEKTGNSAKKAACTYLYLILHQEFNISVRQIALFVNKNARNIQRCIAKLKYQVEFFDEERERYDDMVENIKERLSIDE
jgi:hypothetical protein